MKTILAIVALLVVLFFAFVYFHSKSIGRAHLIYSANELFVAHEQLRQHGAITNASRYTHVYAFTNRVTVGGTEFVCELAADVPDFANVGSLVATADGTLIWMDREREPTIMRGPDHRFVIPERFHDF